MVPAVIEGMDRKEEEAVNQLTYPDVEVKIHRPLRPPHWRNTKTGEVRCEWARPGVPWNPPSDEIAAGLWVIGGSG